MTIKLTCPICGGRFERAAGHVNRSRARGNNLYCGRRCSGIGRRKHRTDAEKRQRKAEYDKRRRAEKAPEIKAAKAAYHRRTYDPVKAAIERKKRAAAHAEYCRRPEYRKWKSGYDRQRRARLQYGEWAECFLLTQDIREACLVMQSDYEIRLNAGTLNKRQKRKRDYERSHSTEPQAGALGDAGQS